MSADRNEFIFCSNPRFSSAFWGIGIDDFIVTNVARPGWHRTGLGRFISSRFLRERLESIPNPKGIINPSAMKIKTAFALSLVVNAVLLTTVAYIVLKNEPLETNPIIIINRPAPEQSNNAPSPAPNIAALPN